MVPLMSVSIIGHASEKEMLDLASIIEPRKDNARDFSGERISRCVPQYQLS
jgi:hypothetical protein